MSPILVVTILCSLALAATTLALVLGRGRRAVELSRSLEEMKASSERQAQALRQELVANIAALSGGLTEQQSHGRVEQTAALERVRDTLARNLEDLRKENDAKLEAVRQTVDEKLQGTLDARLNESFKQVSERLESVHRGLGEMKGLAEGVGDLKRVLTNVKARGGWAEVQLGALLEDILTADQYVRNAALPPGSGQLVEYAVRLPGAGDDEPCFVPIDAKFPNEDYERLLAAQELGEAAAIEAAAAALERALRSQATRIGKYICPPTTTNFALMYLPTEGLFAEALRRAGLAADLQAKSRVIVAGPTTLAALLSSLQMGFTTLAIQKRSSEVWRVLEDAKTEFGKMLQLWDKLDRQLEAVRNTVRDGGVRNRGIERALRHVAGPEANAVDPAPQLIALAGGREAAGGAA